MIKRLEHFLLSVLLGLTVLLGLSFWLDINFGFNLFYRAHWVELAKLQATQTPVNPAFYVSIGVGVMIFLIGLTVIYLPVIRHKIKQKENANAVPPAPILKPKDHEINSPIPEPVVMAPRPPRLKLPKNISEVAAKRHEQQIQNQNAIKHQEDKTKEYNSALSEIFINNGYVVKPNPKISGLTPNLFAIGNGEILWIGAVDCEINDLKNAVEKLNTVFHDTLEDIEIDTKAFIIDTLQKYNTEKDITVFHSIDDLRQFISENPAKSISNEEQENFDAYSEYIDTIIQYIPNA